MRVASDVTEMPETSVGLGADVALETQLDSNEAQGETHAVLQEHGERDQRVDHEEHSPKPQHREGAGGVGKVEVRDLRDDGGRGVDGEHDVGQLQADDHEEDERCEHGKKMKKVVKQIFF